MTEENPFIEVIAKHKLYKKPVPSYRDLAFQWLDMTREERISNNLPTMQNEFARVIGIGTTKMKLLKREFYDSNLKGKIDHSGIAIPDEIFNQPEEMRRQTILALFDKTISKGDHNAAFRLAQIMGWIVEKSEHKVSLELTADEIARRNLEAERELEQWRRDRGYRVEEVQEEPPILLD